MDTNNLLSWIYIISFPMTLILLWIWKKRIHHPLLGIGSLCFFTFHLCLVALDEHSEIARSAMRCA